MLSDVTVLELGSRTGTAYCGKLLHDLGATVVKLEPDGGNWLRTSEPDYAAFLDAGKLSITGEPGQRLNERIAALARSAQIVISDDESAETSGQLALLRSANPRLVLVTISDYGQDGPFAGRPASEFTLQAEGGVSVLHPVGDRAPVATRVELAELSSAAAAALGALTALISLEADPAGSAMAGIDVDVSRFESVVGMLQVPWLFEQISDHHGYPTPQMPVPGLELAKDGWVCAVAVTPPQWATFKKMAGIPELDDSRFDTLDERVIHRGEVTELVRRFTSSHTVEELVALGAQFRVPVTPVGTPETLAGLPPYAGRASYVRNAAGGFVQPRSPFRVGGGDWVPEPPPAPGADNDRDFTPVASSAVTWPGDRDRPLAGLRVLELGTFQAGPLVTMNLAKLGADVVKVEAVNRPDLIRFAGPLPGVDQFWDRGGPYVGSNLGKRSITADISAPDGLEIVRRLIARSDVVLENYVPRVLDERGLNYAGVSAIRPDVVMVRLPAWGLDGPWRDRPGFTYSVDATSGLSNLTGYPDDDPAITGSVVDPIAAIFTTLATLAAVRRQRRTGLGGQLEVALCDIATQLTARSVVEASATGSVPTRIGNRHPRHAPQGLYRAGDHQWIALSIESDAQWKAFAGQPSTKDWADDQRFATETGRRVNHDELDERLAAYALTAPAATTVHDLHTLGVPAGVLSWGANFPQHPQLLARGRVYQVDHAVIGTVDYIGSAARLSHQHQSSMPWATPVFGQHNREVLGELGYRTEQIDAFYESKLLGDSPFGLPMRPATA